MLERCALPLTTPRSLRRELRASPLARHHPAHASPGPPPSTKGNSRPASGARSTRLHPGRTSRPRAPHDSSPGLQEPCVALAGRFDSVRWAWPATAPTHGTCPAPGRLTPFIHSAPPRSTPKQPPNRSDGSLLRSAQFRFLNKRRQAIPPATTSPVLAPETLTPRLRRLVGRWPPLRPGHVLAPMSACPPRKTQSRPPTTPKPVLSIARTARHRGPRDPITNQPNRAPPVLGHLLFAICITYSPAM